MRLEEMANITHGLPILLFKLKPNEIKSDTIPRKGIGIVERPLSFKEKSCRNYYLINGLLATRKTSINISTSVWEQRDSISLVKYLL